MNKIIMLLLVLSVIVLPGCATVDERNNQRIETYKKCIEAGMDSYVAENGYLYCDAKN